MLDTLCPPLDTAAVSSSTFPYHFPLQLILKGSLGVCFYMHRVYNHLFFFFFLGNIRHLSHFSLTFHPTARKALFLTLISTSLLSPRYLVFLCQTMVQDNFLIYVTISPLHLLFTAAI